MIKVFKLSQVLLDFENDLEYPVGAGNSFNWFCRHSFMIEKENFYFYNGSILGIFLINNENNEKKEVNR